MSSGAYVTPSTFGENANHDYPFKNGYQSIVFCVYRVKQNYGMDVQFTKSPFVGTGNESGSVIIISLHLKHPGFKTQTKYCEI